MAKKKVSKKKRDVNLKNIIVLLVIVLIGLFIWAMVAQGSFDEGEELGAEGELAQAAPKSLPPLRVVAVKRGGVFSKEITDLCPTMILNSNGDKPLNLFPIASFFLKSTEDVRLNGGNLIFRIGPYNKTSEELLAIVDSYHGYIVDMRNPVIQRSLGPSGTDTGVTAFEYRGRVYLMFDDIWLGEDFLLKKNHKYTLAVFADLNKHFDKAMTTELFLTLPKDGHSYSGIDEREWYEKIAGAPKSGKRKTFTKENCPLVPNPNICKSEAHTYLDSEFHMGETRLINGHKVEYVGAKSRKDPELGHIDEYYFKVDGEYPDGLFPMMLYDSAEWHSQVDITQFVNDGHEHMVILQNEDWGIGGDVRFTLTCAI